MRYDFIISVTLFIIASFLFVGAIYLFTRKEQLSGLKLTGLFVLANAFYAAFYAAFIINDYEVDKLLFNKFQHLAIPYFGVLWFIISLRLLNRQRKIKGSFYLFVFSIPFIVMLANLLYVSNGEWYQTLYYVSHVFRPFNGIHYEGFNVIIYQKGIFYYIQASYNALLLVLSTLNFYKSYRGSAFLAKNRSFILLLVSFIGFLLIAFQLLSNQSSALDSTPYLISVFSFILFFALFNYELFDLVPKAYQLVYEKSLSPIVILDETYTMVSMNEQAKKIFVNQKNHPHGLRLGDLCGSSEPIIDDLFNNLHHEISMTVEGVERFYSLELQILPGAYLNKKSKGYCVIFYDITQQKEELSKMEKMASYDGLTNIYNRRYFYQLATEAFDLAQIEHKNIVTVMFDLDDFKIVNDIYGHQAGDYVLEEMASLLSKMFGSEGIFARYGGEEFIYMQTGVSINDIKTKIQDICNALSNHAFVYNHRKMKVTASFGVSGTKTVIEKALDTYIKEADDMLYCAKRNGKNQALFSKDLE